MTVDFRDGVAYLKAPIEHFTMFGLFQTARSAFSRNFQWRRDPRVYNKTYFWAHLSVRPTAPVDVDNGYSGKVDIPLAGALEFGRKSARGRKVASFQGFPTCPPRRGG